MRIQDPKKRIKNFNEVALGLTEEEAKKEAARCLQCKKALCIGGCPIEIDIPAFIKLIVDGEFGKAASKIKTEKILTTMISSGRFRPPRQKEVLKITAPVQNISTRQRIL